MAAADQHADRGADWINLLWLSKLRWGAILGQLATIFGVHVVMRIALPLVPLSSIVGLEAASNLAVMWWLRRGRPAREWMLGALMAFDVLALTGLLYLTGGPFNPFSFIYLVHIALAAAVLRARWTWTLVILSLGCFGALFWDHVWLKIDPAPARDMQHMRMHLEGMWVAFMVAAAFIAYFVTRVRRALAAREDDLARARDLAGRAERLASLATLAAGAAHELSTPLGTIAVAARELELEFQQRIRDEPEMFEDLQLIRGEVQRCRGILDQMAADAGATAGDRLASLSVRELVARAAQGLPHELRRVAGDEDALDAVIEVPSRAVEQALRAVIKNAREATPEGEEVSIEVRGDGAWVEIEVRDRGAGMDPATLARLGEPFFTTKEAGRGMGLGVFLARTVLHRLGGRLHFSSAPGAGTSATLRVPLRCDKTPLSGEHALGGESIDVADLQTAAARG